jgi:hypothetical protein
MFLPLSRYLVLNRHRTKKEMEATEKRLKVDQVLLITQGDHDKLSNPLVLFEMSLSY